ncbi:unnamed protein product, partial [marine sediment metagenome]
DIYKTLSEQQRLRYNQLQGLYTNEQYIFFESTLTQTLFGGILNHKKSRHLHDQVVNYVKEENNHWRWFDALNKKCAPQFYQDTPFKFIELSKSSQSLWDFLARHVNWFPMFLWFIYLQEERAMHNDLMIAGMEGIVEPHFVSVHKKHAQDEQSHGDVVSDLLGIYWHPKSITLKKLNVKLLNWAFFEYFLVPKRSAVHVLDEWFKEFPMLAHRKQEILNGFNGLRHNRDFVNAMYGENIIPNTVKLMNKCAHLKPFIGELC